MKKAARFFRRYKNLNFNAKNVGAYELKQDRPLEDIHSEGLYLVHKKSGAKVVVISNEDENKVFYIGFRTPPRDSTGVAHIIEHTVLCGSDKFPVKEPFIELLKGSMNTFLNAMTYPDKTVYPVASCNDRDFQNLMDVYMDAVLNPNIYKEKNIFRQEGWHYELNTREDDLKINGVVYNEMKGAFSSADSVLEREILNSLYPDTTYKNESGGDPDVIPQLTYEDYLDFHRTYYHPSNSYIYLYGNMDIEEKLNWLDQEYLCHYDRLEVDSAIPLQKPFGAPVEVERFYSVSSAESEDNRSYLSYNCSIGTNLDPKQYLAFQVLDYALLSSQGAPVKQALLDAGIGDDIYGGYDSGVFQPYYSIIAKNTNADEQERFCKVIRDTLESQVRNGLDQKTLLAAINGSEFRFREADFGRFPKGLMFGLQLLDSWLYADDQAFLHLDELKIFEELRNEIPTGYFEELITRYLLDNTHVSLVRILPKKGLNARKEQLLQEKLNAYRDSLDTEELDRIIRETKELAAYQEAPSSKEDLDKIPLLSREDMKKQSDPYSNIEADIQDVRFLRHDYETNGIIYLDYLFDIRHIEEDKIPYVAILNLLLGRLDTRDYSYSDLTNEIHLYTGGVSTETNVFTPAEDEQNYKVKFEVRMRTLEANLQKTMELARSMMLHTLFTDDKRIFEILAQTKSRMQSELSESGNSVAASRALSYYSAVSRVGDLLHGIGVFRVLEGLVSDFENRKEELKELLKDLLSQILQKSNLLVSYTGSEKAFAELTEHAGLITDGLYPDTKKTEAAITLPSVVNEGFMDASQIQYVAMAGSFKKKGFAYNGALRVFRTIMNYEYLWQNVRVRGGAYGCGCNASRTGDIYFSSYRDPNLKQTMEVYRKAADYLRAFDVDDRDMTRYVIGTFSEMDAPLTPVSRGRRSLQAVLTGLTYEMIQKERQDVLKADQESIRALADLLAAAMEDAYVCAIGNEEKIKQESDVFAHLEHLVQSPQEKS